MHQTRTSHHRLGIHSRRLVCALATLAVASTAGFGLSAAPALALSEACPNATLRAENNSTRLPECRAYEAVSPAFKEGFAPYLYGYSDNGAFGYTSIGNFDENGMGQATGNQYLATRSVTGWKTVGLAPSGPVYSALAGLADASSSDLLSSVWMMRRADEPANVADFYLRDPDGVFTRIGPSANPAKLPPELPGATNTGPLKSGAVVGASADLSHVLFVMLSEYSYPGDTSGGVESLYEYVGTGNERPVLVGVDNSGQLISNAQTCPKGISSDGTVVFFDPGCSGGIDQVWARINATTTIHASASQCTRTAGDPGGLCNASAAAEYAGAAGDGSRVFFTTTQQLVNGDTDQGNDLYECDIPPGTPAPVGLANPCPSLSEISGAATGADVENVVRVSGDGSRVYFVANGVLAANLGTNDAAAVAGDHNLYVWEKDAAHPAGQTTFVTKLAVNDVNGTYAQTTDDGRYLLFTTANQLLSSDTDEAVDVYRYDADTGMLLRLSTDTSGTGGNTPGMDAEVDGATFRGVARPQVAISSDGSTVVFLTSEGLSPADTNGTTDVYEWHEGRVSLISSGRPSAPFVGKLFATVSGSGSDIYFNTTAQLTPGDTDTLEDIYDARVGGGFSVATPPPCTGEACEPAISNPPSAPATGGSSAFNGPGNLATPPPSAPAPEAKPMTRAQKLAKALKACKSKRDKKKRSTCEKRARRAYGRSK